MVDASAVADLEKMQSADVAVFKELSDIVRMLATVGECSQVNSSSDQYQSARRQVARSCGVDS